MNNKKYNILCVEDNRINQMILVKALDGLDVNVTLANDGKEALSLLKDNANQSIDNALYDLIIMDCNMPEMDGFEATQYIRTHEDYTAFKDLPIIAMTGNENVANKERCLATGMNDFLTKPIDRELLHKRVNYWLSHEVSTLGENTLAIEEPSRKLEHEPVNTQTVWDKESFLKRVKHNQILAEQIIVLFLKEMPSVFESLLRAIAEDNMEQVFLLAHKLKGTVNNLSGCKLANLLQHVEIKAKENNTDALEQLTDMISQEFILLIRHLNAYI